MRSVARNSGLSGPNPIIRCQPHLLGCNSAIVFKYLGAYYMWDGTCDVPVEEEGDKSSDWIGASLAWPQIKDPGKIRPGTKVV